MPAKWRVDIMDSEGSTPTTPYLLTMGPVPLVLERMTEDEGEQSRIIGLQATIQYEYTGEINIPLPEEFFEASERRFRIEIRKNGILDSILFIRPDNCDYPDGYPPFTVSLIAVDGFSYAKGQNFNVYQESGLLLYDKINIYDTLMTRGLLQIMEPTSVIRVLQSLYPENIEVGEKMLFGLSIHTDIFYDFVQGPVSVHNVVTELCKTFSARCFSSQGKLWFIRTQDLDQVSFTIDEYTDDNTVTEISVPMLRRIGPLSSFDGVMMEPTPNIRMEKAVKRAEFEVAYKSINQLTNFDWSDYDGSDFSNWFRSLGTTAPAQIGSGTPENPYRAELFYDTDMFHNISQGFNGATTQHRVRPGDIIEIAFPYEWNNTQRGAYLIDLDTLDSDFDGWRMNASGGWVQDGAGITVSDRIFFNRTGKKPEGSITLKSQPIPSPVRTSGSGAIPTEYRLSILFWGPDEMSDIVDSGDPASIRLGRVKMGVIQFDAEGRHLTAINQADFSQVLDTQKFTFIDTGEDGLSNTIFTGDPLEAAENWDNDKTGVLPADIERHMAEAVIDQAPRSPKTWEGTVLSNKIYFHNVLEFSHRPGVRFMQAGDVYVVDTCLHQFKLREVFEEGNADIQYSEFDIEDTEN